MIRSRLVPVVSFAFLTLGIAFPAHAVSKKKDCSYQAAVAKTVQNARMAGIPMDQVQDYIVKAKPSWPDQYNNAIPIFAAQIYQLKKKDLKNTDLGKEWMNTCMSN